MRVLKTGKAILMAGTLALVLATGARWAGGAGGTPAKNSTFTLTESSGKFSLHAEKAQVREIFRQIESHSGIKLTIDENLREVVSIDLKDLSAEDLLKALSKSGSYVYEKDGKGGLRLVSASASSQQKGVAKTVLSPNSGQNSQITLKLAKGQLSNIEKPTKGLFTLGAKAILLENAIIDSAAFLDGHKLNIPDSMRAKADEKNYIVQFDHLINAEDRAAVSNAGGRIGHYIPNDALFVSVDHSGLSDMSKVPGVILVEPYHPYFKLSRDIVAYESGLANDVEQSRAQIGSYTVMFVDEKKTASQMLGSSIDSINRDISLGGHRIATVQASASNLLTMAGSSDVLWIEPAMPRRALNDIGGSRIRGTQFKKLHPTLTGNGVVVGVTDTGVDFNHEAFSINQLLPTSTNFNTRIVGYYYATGGGTSDGLPGDTVGHGSHVSGTILGNGALSRTVNKAPGSGTAPYATNQFAGVAPNAQLVMVEDFNSYSDQAQLKLEYDAGARLNNNSWGAALYQYSALSYAWDVLVPDYDSDPNNGYQPFIAFFAAGNDGNGNDNGNGGVAGSVGSPGNAKNVITVGAVEEARFAGNYPNARIETDSDWQIASYSSRGPVSATDFRRKPEVVACGSYVLSVQSRDTNPDDLVDPILPERDYRYGNLDSGTNYAFLSGTSMATPMTTGAGALLYEYYTNKFGRAPSPAMMKAMLVNGARNINSIAYPKGNGPYIPNTVYFETPCFQGYGLVDVVRSADGPQIHATDQNIMLDEGTTTPLNTGDAYTYNITVNPGEGGLKVTMAYTDFPGTPGNARSVVNILELFVIGPNGITYLGNLFSGDGVHSLPVANGNVGVGADGDNNVQQIIIPEAVPGTYTIRVSGFNVPVGPQSFALSMFKGTALEGRTPGNNPAIALDTNYNPVVAYSASDIGGNEQIFVRQWAGPIGDQTTFGTWKKLEDQWYGLRDSGNYTGTGISRSLEPSRRPSVAIDGQNVFVAWEQYAQVPNQPARVYLRQYNGSDWIELNNSARADGVVGSVSPFDSLNPVVRVMGHAPIVAWRQILYGATRVLAATCNGSTWVGLGGSNTSNGIPGSTFAANLDMIVDVTGAPVVAWEEQNDQRIHIRRWNGSTWSDLGMQGASPYAASPRLATDSSGTLYLTWIQTPNGSGTNYFQQIYVSKFQGGVWQGIAGSTNYPGISQNFNTTNSTISSPSISMGRNNDIFVSWTAGDIPENSVLVKKYSAGQWTSAAGAGTPPGVGFNNGTSAHSGMACDSNGIPFVVFDNDGSGSSEVFTYALSSDRNAPVFGGLQTAVGNTNSGVNLGWMPASDFSTSITYRIYRSTSSVPCGTSASCDPSAVFANLIAAVTNQTSIVVAGLTAGRVYCFGVRASDENGFTDQNNVVLPAGPSSGGSGDDDSDCLSNAQELLAGTDTCQKDTDGDGLWDGWEWAFSTNSPVHTNSAYYLAHNFTNDLLFLSHRLSMEPLDNGITKVVSNGTARITGDAMQDPLADLDGDGLANIDEFNWWLSHGAICPPGPANSPDPTNPDTDGDGMNDGWEVQYGLSPVSAVGVNGPSGDPTSNGVPNIIKYQYGLNPFLVDSDGDGLSDSNEIYVTHSDPAAADSDQDGLDDAFELSIGTNPTMADSATNSLLSDGDVWQLGWTNRSSASTYEFILRENFETPSRTNWTHNSASALLPRDLWHLTLTDPAPSFTNHPVKIAFMNQRTTNVSYRMARDLSATNGMLGTNVMADYNVGTLLQCALNSPRFDAVTNSCLFMQWNEYYETEPNFDTVQVQVRANVGGITNWFIVGQQLSGKTITTNPWTHAVTNGWVHRSADLSRFAGQADLQIRFLFTAQNSINNNFRGWWVDDVSVYGAVVVGGWVRDVRGRPVEGGQVYAIGLGGVTNFVQGHRISGAGKIFGSTKTAADGSFTMSGLPHGKILLKASSANLAAEFYNGPLFIGSYAFGAGITNNFGLPDADLAKASPKGVLDIRTTNAFSSAFFELDQGKGRAFIGAAGASATLKLENINVLMWNGSTSTPAMVTWTNVSSVGLLSNNHPDWVSAPVAPKLMGDAAPGLHMLLATPSQSTPPPVTEVREGETILVQLATNQTQGSIYAYTQVKGTYALWMDGVVTTASVPGTVFARAGTHFVTLTSVSSNGVLHPGIKKVEVQPGLIPTRVMFSTNDMSLYPGVLSVQAYDIQGNAITGAQVLLNGTLLTSNDVANGVTITEPTTIRGLLPGDHYISLVAPGYRPSELRTISIFSGSSNNITFTLYDADRDYDQVGDPIEVLGYTNIFKYSRGDDPDADGLTNLQEYDLFREFNVRVNPFVADSDGDGVSDGAEVAYDGIPGRLALSKLATNAVQDSSWAAIYFSGKYLAGIDYFGRSNVVASIEGDRFEAALSTHPQVAVPNRQWALTVFTNIPPLVHERAISEGHNPDSQVFSDTRPDIVDTDGDGMWDGFETIFGTMASLASPNTTIRILDPLEGGQYSNANADPDADGLTNYQEFIGPDGITNLVWSNPTTADSDNDGIPDGWEIANGLNPLDPNDAFEDPDGDGLVNLGEYLVGTDPHNPDTDGDFLPDGQEVLVYGTDPRNPDTDGDGLIDGREVWDKDLDGIPDGGFFPMWNGGDLDGDGLVDGPTDWDTDGDGMPDGFEVLDNFGRIRPPGATLDPYNPFDGAIDSDGDGLSNLQEYLVKDGLYGHPPSEFDPAGHGGVIWQYSTDPFNADSDGDGMPDGFEVMYGLAPMDPSPNSAGSSVVLYTDLLPEGDPDGDGLWNDREYRIRFLLDSTSSANAVTSLSTSPWNPDTDGDGLGDGEEDRVFRSNPVVQDSDGDMLPDGVNSNIAGRAAEVETVSRRSEFQYVPGNVLWLQARDLAHIPHPVYPWIFGHLATLENTNQIPDAIAALGGANDVAIGGFGEQPDPLFCATYHWTTYEALTPDLTLVLPCVLPFASTNYLMLNSDGSASLTPDFAPGGYLIEWDNVPQTDAHYDGGTNDLWIMGVITPTSNPNEPMMPYWFQINPDDAGGTLPPPEPRWSQTAAYIPTYVQKAGRNLKGAGTLIMDNRTVAVMGGSGGVSRYKDVWEYTLRDNQWHKSAAPLNHEAGGPTPPGLNFDAANYPNGLSDAAAFTRHINLRTGPVVPDSLWVKDPLCPCGNVPWNCDGEGFGEPKRRPWSGGTLNRSFDITYLFDGFDTAHLYFGGANGYKVADDPTDLTETSDYWDSAAYEYQQVVDNQIIAAIDNNPTEIRIGNQAPVALLSGTGIVVRGFLTGFAGFTFQPMPFDLSCENIDQVILHLRVQNRTNSTINTTMGLEFGSAAAYNTPPPGGRWPPGSTTIPLTFTPGENDTQNIDITAQFIEVLSDGAWGGPVRRLGLVFDTDVPADPRGYAVIYQQGANPNRGTTITVTYKPHYKLNPNWADILFALPGHNNGSSGIPTNGPGVQPISITASNVVPKNAGIAYDYTRDRYLVFGGLDGRNVIGDTWECQLNPQSVYWSTTTSAPVPASPPARWGHTLVYDKSHDWYVMFGGFDQKHRPLNDLWLYIPNATLGAGGWVQVTKTASTDQWPSPRGGHSMIYWGDFDWDSGIPATYCVANNMQRAVLFGGTDGNSCFNDTWLFNGNTLKWTLVNPSGIWGGNGLAPSPSPRAFASLMYAQNALGEQAPCAGAAAFLFGGHVGVSPTGKDSDFDLVDDGVEHQLNGAQERDPRYNRMFSPTAPVPETLPYTFTRIGSVPWAWTPLTPNFTPRGAIADFETLNNEDNSYAKAMGLPFESHPLSGRVNQFVAFIPGTYYTAEAGVDANTIQQTQLWYHQFGGENPFDVRDVWQLGAPDASTAGTNAVPPSAYSGRWCYGTKLNGFYPNNAIMDLYSPLISLALPVADSTAQNPNFNEFYLVFHEWLDLADTTDSVRVDMLRPVTASDILSRKTGLTKPVVRVLPNRNNFYNTKGGWRRVIVPVNVAANETNFYFRFTLQSDSNKVAGGWYIDDVALIQGGTINGMITNVPNGEVVLMGINSVGSTFTNSLTDGSGFFQFGLLPDGDYQVGSGGGIIGQFSVGDANGWNNNTGTLIAPQVAIGSITPNPGGGMAVTWSTTPSLTYRVEYSDTGIGGPYFPLITITAAAQTETYIDYSGSPSRFYRVVQVTNL